MGLRLRPATPLSLLFLIAFVLLLLSTISTPIIKAIPLATFEGVDYGVFGACKGSVCTPIQIGYNPSDLLGTNDDGDFSLPASTRHSLSAILIVHPVAAFLTLICFGLAVASHFHSPAHSPRYLLALLILSFPTLLVSLLAFLVDILLFVPHMQWGGWIVLAATILIVASGVVTCAMRRTLVSRKARKKRIAENAEMSGENYYADRAPRLATDDAGLPRADSPPPMSGDPKAAQFATFDTNRSPDERKSSDDREPLNPRAPSVRSTSTNGTRRPMPSNEAPPPMPGYGPQRPTRDQYGDPLPPAAVAMASDLPPPGLRHHGSRGSMDSQGSQRSYRSNGSRGAPPGYGRGRGGYPPRGGPQRGNFGPRGGYGPGPNYGPRGGQNGSYRGGRGGMPPQGYNGGPAPRGMSPGPRGMSPGPMPPQGYNGGPAPRGMSPGPRGMGPGTIMAGAGLAASEMNRGPAASPPGYDVNDYYGNDRILPPPSAPAMQTPRDRSPATRSNADIGQAIEMDERHGSLSPQQSNNAFGLRDSDGDVAGIVALQQGRSSPMRAQNSPTSNPSSVYADQ